MMKHREARGSEIEREGGKKGNKRSGEREKGIEGGEGRKNKRLPPRITTSFSLFHSRPPDADISQG